MTPPEMDWLIRGYVTKILGYAIILFGIIIALYRYFLGKSVISEAIVLIISAMIIGGLFLLLSRFYLHTKKKWVYKK